MTDQAVRSVLFLCVANSARSQMAEALARSIFNPSIRVQSAGSRPKGVNPYAVKALAEINLSTDGHHSKSIDSIDTTQVDLAITLCAEEICPVIPGACEHIRWAFQDPDRSDPELTESERLAHFRATRNLIADRLRAFAVERQLRRTL